MTIRKHSRRGFVKAAGIGAASVVSARSVLAGRPGTPRRRPNVLFIITDDQHGNSFGFLGGKVLTPNIDRLASESVYFTRGYASTSVCTPSRYSCLTGRYASRCRSENFQKATSAEGQTDVQWNVHLTTGEITLPMALQKAGYVTGIVGKWHNGAPPGWARTRNRIRPNSDPADPEVAKMLKDNQETLHAWIRSLGFDYVESINLGNFSAHPCRALRHHNQEWITKGALDFINQNKDKPFYLYMATSLLHGPSPLASLKADPRITHAGLLDKPLEVQPSRESVLARARAAGVADRLAPATWLDDGIGAVLKRLDELGLAEDTLVFYFNDNGMGGKGSLYEDGVRTPTLMRWKGAVAPGRRNELVQNIDFAPTILEACGVKPPQNMRMDGRSLLPMATGRSAEWRDSLFFEIGHTRAVCTKKWKYIAFRIPPSRQLTKEQRRQVVKRYTERKKKVEGKSVGYDPDAPLSHLGFPGGQGTERSNAVQSHSRTYYDADQLYDLENDPKEQKNLATDPAHKETLREMKALLRKHLADVPGTFAEFKGRR